MRRPSAGRPTLALATLALAACSSGQIHLGPPARPGERITGWTEVLRDRPGHELFLRNNTEEPLRVTAITLYECQNVQGGCYQFDPELVLEPGQVRRIRTLEPELRNRPYHFRWRWSSSGVR